MPGASLRFSGDAGAVEKVSLEGSFVARWGGPSGTPAPTKEERSAFVIVGATCVSPVEEGENTTPQSR